VKCSRRRLPRARSAVVLAAVALAGCGPLDRAELKRGVESLSAVTAEGRLLADGVASDRTRSTYVRVHARELGDEVQHESEKLADATTASGLEGSRDAAVTLAGRLGDALGELQTRPGDEAVGDAVRASLARVSDDLDTVSQQLDPR
jgi:hypothetical protein